MVTWTDDKLPIPIKHKPRVRPAREDKVIIDWTTELTRGFRAAIEDKDESCSVKMSGAIQTEGAARIELAQQARRSHPDGTSTFINFNDCDGDVPEPFSSRVSPPFNVGLEENTSSWTSRVVDDDDDDDDDDIYDEDRHEEHAVSPEASSVYSRDERDTDSCCDVSPEDPMVHSDDERDQECDRDESKALTKWDGNDEAASCFESMGWGGPKK